MKKNHNLKIINWNIYNASIPFTANFKKEKDRPVIVLKIIGGLNGNAIIIPISSKITKRSKYDIEITLNQKSLIKVANIQSITISNILSPYYSITSGKIFFF